jgi:serine/threonine protein kinase
MSSGPPTDRELLAGHFRILETLDENGRLFKAHDRRQRRLVVLKVLSPPFVRDAVVPKAFMREINAASRLVHPNLSAVLGAGEDRGVPFVVMQYAAGNDLDRVVRDRGPLSIDEVLAVMIQAARGLEAAHDGGFIHGGLKPSKLMLDAAGTTCVLGWSLARLIATASPLKAAAGPHASAGIADRTAADFEAPEQASHPRIPDPRSDIYSLGCILYFLLTGREPFVGETLGDRLRAHRECPAPTPRVLRPDVPSALDELYRRMMAKHPEERPGSMTEVVARLAASKCAAPSSSQTASDVTDHRQRSARVKSANERQSSAKQNESRARGAPTTDSTASSPIGPEFDLAGLGLEGRSGPEEASSRRASIGARFGESRRPAAAERPISRRFVGPALALGLAAIALVTAVVLQSMLRSTSSVPQLADGGDLITSEEAESSTSTNSRPASQPEWATRTIFDGKSSRGWMLTSKRPLSQGHVQPDGLNPHRSGSYLVVYEDRLGDFILDFDYKLSVGCDTGVFLRVGDLDDPVSTGIEVSIADTAGLGYEDSGAIFGLVAPSVNAQKPAGQWNHMTISAHGPIIAVNLNGTYVAQTNLDEWTTPGKRPDGSSHKFASLAIARLPRSGYLGFQDLVGDCWFRHVVLKTPAGSTSEAGGVR